MSDITRVMRRSTKVPLTVEFVNEHDEPLEDLGILELTPAMRLVIADLSIKWKQSVQVTLERFITRALREAAKREGVLGEDYRGTARTERTGVSGRMLMRMDGVVETDGHVGETRHRDTPEGRA